MRKILFSDEKIFRLYQEKGTGKWMKPNETNFVRRRTQTKGVMVWLVIGRFENCNDENKVNLVNKFCVTPMVIDGTMKTPEYIEVMKRKILPLNCKKFVFQQDNAPSHVSKGSKAFFAKEEISLLGWPALSPDLNVIETLWAYLAARMPICKNIEDVRQHVSALLRLPKTEQFIEKLLNSFPKRCRACVDEDGGITRY